MSKITIVPYITEGAFSINDNSIGFVSNNVLNTMQGSMKGVPLTEEHDGNVAGRVLDAYYKPENGWYYAVIEVKNEDVLEKYKGVSCAYSGIWNETPYIHNGVKYSKTLENGEYYELALVNNPRYEEAKIQKNSKDNHKIIGIDMMEEKQKNDEKQAKENLLTQLRKLLFGSEKNDDEPTKKEEDKKQKNEPVPDKKEKVDTIVDNDVKKLDRKASESDIEKLIDEKVKNAMKNALGDSTPAKPKDDDEHNESQKKGEQQHQDMQKNSMQNHIISADDAIINNFETCKYSPNPKDTK